MTPILPRGNKKIKGQTEWSNKTHSKWSGSEAQRGSSGSYSSLNPTFTAGFAIFVQFTRMTIRSVEKAPKGSPPWNPLNMFILVLMRSLSLGPTITPTDRRHEAFKRKAIFKRSFLFISPEQIRSAFSKQTRQHLTRPYVILSDKEHQCDIIHRDFSISERVWKIKVLHLPLLRSWHYSEFMSITLEL